MLIAHGVWLFVGLVFNSECSDGRCFHSFRSDHDHAKNILMYWNEEKWQRAVKNNNCIFFHIKRAFHYLEKRASKHANIQRARKIVCKQMQWSLNQKINGKMDNGGMARKSREKLVAQKIALNNLTLFRFFRFFPWQTFPPKTGDKTCETTFDWTMRDRDRKSAHSWKLFFILYSIRDTCTI